MKLASNTAGSGQDAGPHRHNWPLGKPGAAPGRRTLWRALLATIAVLLSACASLPAPVAPPAALFHDEFFPAAPAVSTADLFTVSEAMQRFLTVDIGKDVHRKGPTRALVDGLIKNGRLWIEYDSSQTRTAAQTFDAHAGNCLSLVIMTAAMAKQMGLPVTYHDVHVTDIWSRSHQTLFRIGHVNITVGNANPGGFARDGRDPPLTIDFLPPADRNLFNSSDISEARVVAMYLNNRAAELLMDGQLDEAYAHARQAIRTDPGYVSAINTLAVIYRRHGQLDAAVAALNYYVNRYGDETTVLTNLAVALRELGKPDEAALVQARLDRLPGSTPFQELQLGQTAMKRGDYTEAIQHFRRELKNDPDYHETHLGLAIAYFQLGNYAMARSHLLKAQAGAETSQDRIRYTAKLDRLRAEHPG